MDAILKWVQLNGLYVSLGAAIVLGLLLLVMILRRRKRTRAQAEDLYGEHYFDESAEENNFQGKAKSRRLERDKKAVTVTEEPLIIVLFVTAKQTTGFSGIDIFSVLEEVGCEHGKHKIFHHFGVGNPKAKQEIFSIASMLEPGIFNPEEKNTFSTSGLAVFLQLPGVFGGRVAFELMLSTTQRIAEMLEGQIRDERHRPLEPAMIDELRARISKFEQV